MDWFIFSHALINYAYFLLKVKRRTSHQRYLLSPKRKMSYSYSVTVLKQKQKVCKKAFHLLHGIRQGRIEKKVKDQDGDIFDKRGRHTPKNKLPDSITAKIKELISSLPVKESHYCREKSREILYLDSTFTVRLMHRLFNKKYPHDQVKYWKYREVFSGMKNIKIGSPRTDICDTCECLNADIIKAKKDTVEMARLKTVKELRVQKADAFFTQMKASRALAKRYPNDTIVICFDYQKNLPLPLTNTGKEYYMRQLWMHNLGIHNLGTNEATMFVYSEHFAHKGPNEVISCLKWFFDNKVSKSVKIVHVFMDNCFAQCKNKFLLSFWYWLSQSQFQEIRLFYPIFGHSFMPIDRDFAMIEKCKRRCTKAVLPSTWVKLIKDAQPNRPFDVVYAKFPLTDDMEPDGTPVVTVSDFKSELDSVIESSVPLSKTRGFLFLRGELPKSRAIMSDVHCHHVNILKKKASLDDLSLAFVNAALCLDLVPISKLKYDNIFTLLQAVALPENTSFYLSLFHTESPP